MYYSYINSHTTDDIKHRSIDVKLSHFLFLTVPHPSTPMASMSNVPELRQHVG